jgi:nucleotide-binding universal stress UspA family protein
MYQRIMIVVDEGAIARAAVDEGLALARVHGAEVLFFHVLPNYIVPMDDMPPLVSLGPEKYEKAVRRAADKILGAATQLAAEHGVKATGIVGSGMDAAECISVAAAQRGCDLIVVGSHGRTAIQRLIMGSVVTRLVTLASMPLLVCKRGVKEPVRTAKVVALPKRKRVRRGRAAAAA